MTGNDSLENILKDSSHRLQHIWLEEVAKTLGIVAGFQIEITILNPHIKNDRLNAQPQCSAQCGSRRHFLLKWDVCSNNF